MTSGRYQGLVPLRIALAVVIVLAAGIAVLWPRNADIRAGQAALARAERAADAQKRVVTPAELTDTAFDRLVVVHGTDTPDEIRAALGIDWDRADDEAYHCCEPPPIWAFMRGDEVVAYFRPSEDMGYGGDVRPGRYPPDAKLPIGRTYVRSQ